jgi:membrane protein DedA with SNARE-associated domain
MTTGAEVIHQIATHGLWVLAPLGVIEGPVVTIIAGWLVSLGLLSAVPAVICLVVADVVGDCLLYAAGRGLRLDRLPVIGPRLRVPRERMVPLVRAIRQNDVRLLVLGKLTHAAGFAVLIAAGVARVGPGRFILLNTLASIPKTLVLFGLGYLFGRAHEQVAAWLSYGSATLLAVLVFGAGLWLAHRRRAAILQAQSRDG